MKSKAKKKKTKRVEPRLPRGWEEWIEMKPRMVLMATYDGIEVPGLVSECE